MHDYCQPIYSLDYLIFQLPNLLTQASLSRDLFGRNKDIFVCVYALGKGEMNHAKPSQRNVSSNVLLAGNLIKKHQSNKTVTLKTHNSLVLLHTQVQLKFS